MPTKTGKGVLEEEEVDQLRKVDEETGDEVEESDNGNDH